MPKPSWVTRGTAIRGGGLRCGRQVKANHLAALFQAYRKDRNMTSTQIAEKIGCTPQNARVQMNKPPEEWNIGQLFRYCDVLGIPYKEALDAATK